MSRIEIVLPENFPFTTCITVRITDINYGGHAGNDALLGMIHEARIRYLESLGYTEMDCGGTGLIMADVAIQFKAEVFRGDRLSISVAPAELSRAGFVLYYKLERESTKGNSLAAIARTGMVCYNYEQKKVASLPDTVREKLK